MTALKNIKGQRFGKLIVLERAENRIRESGRQDVMWKCKCDCGMIKNIRSTCLLLGMSNSCGCVNIERIRNLNLSHNMCNTKEYKAWSKLKGRCYTKTDNKYYAYGARGIKVCDRWLESFDNFYKDMGDAPTKKHSIDRIDVNGNYEPSNCRWATNKVQSNNKTTNVYVEYGGVKYTLKTLSEHLEIPYKYFWLLYNQSLTIEEIINRNKERLKKIK